MGLMVVGIAAALDIAVNTDILYTILHKMVNNQNNDIRDTHNNPRHLPSL